MKKINGSTLQPLLLKKTAKRKASSKAGAVMQAVATHKANQIMTESVIVYKAVEDLKPAEKQVRKPTERMLKLLRRSMAESDFIPPLLVRGAEVVDGNTRLLAAQQVGLERLPTIDVGYLSEAQCEVLKINMNRLGELAEWNVENLREVIIGLEVEGIDLELTGFSLPEIDIIKLDPLDGEPSKLNELPAEVGAPPVSLGGDLWCLDKHRLLCGSALESDSYKKILAGKTASMLLSDPPFNVKIAGHVSGLGKVKHSEFAQASGEMSDDEFLTFLTTFIKLSVEVMQKGGTALLFIDWRHVADLIAAGKSAALHFINLVVWNKEKGGMGGLYRSAHELICVFCKGGSTPETNNVKLGVHGRDRTNVWTYPGATKPGSSAALMLKDHPTPKPVELLVDAMLDVTKPADLVLDPFMGSGTTIVAAEECGRVACGIELEPKFVDLAVRRWEQVTSKSATLATTGETFAQVAARRNASATAA